MYPDSEKLKEEMKNYINSEDPEFLEKYSDKKWDHVFEKKIHTMVNNLINNLFYIKRHLVKYNVK
jgi:hypothetical protein